MTILDRMGHAWCAAMNRAPYAEPVRWWLTYADLAELVTPFATFHNYHPNRFNGVIISTEIYGQPSRLILENGDSIIL